MTEPGSSKAPLLAGPPPQSARRRWLWIALSVLGTIAASTVLGLLLFGNRGKRSSSRRSAPHPATVLDPVLTEPVSLPDAAVAPRVRPDPREEHTADGLVRIRGRITAGTAPITSFKAHGVSTADALALIRALKGHFDFRRSRPGHRYELHLQPGTRRPLYLRYRVSLSEVYEVRRVGQGYEGRRVPVDVQRRQVGYAGTITSSLGRALAAQGAGPALVSHVAEVLTSQPRFFKALRTGDVFRVLVEEQLVQGQHLRYGPVLALEYQGSGSGRLRLYHFRAGNKKAEYFDERGVSRPQSRLHIPVYYTRISSPFGMRFHPVLKRRIMHEGVDMVAPAGTPVRACLPGTVFWAARRGGYGNLIILQHEDGLLSYYGHLTRFERGIRKGRKVRQRQVIGYVGSTGRSTGPHLHFALKRGGQFIDPLSYKVQPGRPLPAAYRAAFRAMMAKRRRRLEALPLWPLLGLPAQVPKAQDLVETESL